MEIQWSYHYLFCSENPCTSNQRYQCFEWNYQLSHQIVVIAYILFYICVISLSHFSNGWPHVLCFFIFIGGRHQVQMLCCLYGRMKLEIYTDNMITGLTAAYDRLLLGSGMPWKPIVCTYLHLNSLSPGKFKWNFPDNFSDWWLKHHLWNCS